MTETEVLTLRKLLRSACKASKGAPQIVEVGADAPVWRHPWIREKRSLAAFRFGFGESSEGFFATLTEPSPKKNPGRWYLLVVQPSELATTVAEIHRVDGAGSLWWKYVGRKRDGKNALRLKRFESRYPGGIAVLNFPEDAQGTRAFLRELVDVATTRLAADNLEHVEPASPVDDEVAAFEGAKRPKFINHRKREGKLRAAKLEAFQKKHGALFCEVPGCGFDFARRYGDASAAVRVEVHHLRPLARADEPVKTRPSDLAVVCPNCHRMIHHGGGCRKLEKLLPARTPV